MATCRSTGEPGRHCDVSEARKTGTKATPAVTPFTGTAQKATFTETKRMSGCLELGAAGCKLTRGDDANICESWGWPHNSEFTKNRGLAHPTW